jgi:hypothetical protein
MNPYNNMLFEGRVVQLQRFPNQKFIMHNGWFEYDNQRQEGWYFKSVSGNIILPIYPSDLIDMVVVDWNDFYHIPDIPVRVISGEPIEDDPLAPAYITEAEKANYDAAFISVETLEGRDNLAVFGIPNGKIVRVNELGKYYIWNQSTTEWDTLNFSIESDGD